MALNKTIAALGAYSLIRRDPAANTLSIHRLVQAVLRDAMPDDETKIWAERTVLAVSEACPAVEFATWPQWERYLPHALMCADLVEREGLMLVTSAFLLKQTGLYLHEHARYTEAEPLHVRALQIREQQLGPDHPDMARRRFGFYLILRCIAISILADIIVFPFAQQQNIALTIWGRIISIVILYSILRRGNRWRTLALCASP
jgi:hypothetical protein